MLSPWNIAIIDSQWSGFCRNLKGINLFLQKMLTDTFGMENQYKNFNLRFFFENAIIIADQKIVLKMFNTS